MMNGGARPGSGRKKKLVETTEPPRKRGRPSNAERAARAAALGQSLPGGQQPVGDAILPKSAPAGEQILPKQAPAAYTPEMPADIGPKDYFLTLMRDPRVSAERRDRAAQVAIGYVDVKPGEAAKKVGVKEQRLLDAADAVKPGNKYAPGRAPLSVVGKT